jgi:hypothetical protein
MMHARGIGVVIAAALALAFLSTAAQPAGAQTETFGQNPVLFVHGIEGCSDGDQLCPAYMGTVLSHARSARAEIQRPLT